MNRDRLQVILPSRLPGVSATNLTKQQFLEMLETADQEMLRDTFGRAEKNEINVFMSMFFWVIDNDQAIFSFSTYSDNASEHGFFTVDGKLVESFLEIRDRYHRTAKVDRIGS